jgi:hypothetical protein
MSPVPPPLPPPAEPTRGRSATGFAVPGRFHVILLFMTQFILLLAVFGIVVPTLHGKGVSTVLLIAGSVAFVVALQLVLGALGRLLPVRCRNCRAPARFRGFGWWPFIYRYDCRDCGQQMRFEVSG